jgi:hypothetical protein
LRGHCQAVSTLRSSQENGAATHNLRHVENDNGGFETDAETGDETTDNDGSKRVTSARDHLDDDTDHIDEAAQNNSPFATNEVGDVAGNNSAEEGTARQDRDDERGVGFVDFLGADVLDGLDEDLGAEDTVDVAGVVAEEDTAERGEGADQVGLPGDGGLDALNILRDGQAVDVGRGRRVGFLLLRCVRHDGGGRAVVNRADSGWRAKT